MIARAPRDAAGLARLALVLAVALYMLEYLVRERPWTLLDDGVLAIHEAGHVLFSPFGEFLMVLGGSLFQLIVPAVFVAYFARRHDRYAAAVTLFWLAASLFNLAAYVADARAGELPLITGSRSDHDWTWLLIQLGALEHDVFFGRIVRALGFLAYTAAIVLGVHYSIPRNPFPPRDDSMGAWNETTAGAHDSSAAEALRSAGRRAGRGRPAGG